MTRLDDEVLPKGRKEGRRARPLVLRVEGGALSSGRTTPRTRDSSRAGPTAPSSQLLSSESLIFHHHQFSSAIDPTQSIRRKHSAVRDRQNNRRDLRARTHLNICMYRPEIHPTYSLDFAAPLFTFSSAIFILQGPRRPRDLE